jgi:hypothetical protein
MDHGVYCVHDREYGIIKISDDQGDFYMARTVRSSAELKNLPAYRLEYEEHVPDCNGQGMLFRHIKSGARVSVISNEDEN